MQERPLDSFTVIGGTARLDNWDFYKGQAGHLQWYKKRSDGRTHAFYVHAIIDEWCRDAVTVGLCVKFNLSLQSVCARVIVNMPLGSWFGQKAPYDPICPVCEKFVLFKEMGGKL